MNKLYKTPFYILGYKLYRTFNWPRLLPISLTSSVTNRCNSRCKTCNLWKFHAPEDELTVEEWKKIFQSLGKSVVWLTFSGGDQFLRKNFYKIVNYAVEFTKPCLINIPLSNRDVNKTIQQIIKILEYSKTPLMINISLDGTEHVHNLLRGRKGSFRTTIEIFKRLKELKKMFPQLSVCFNTVVSNYNICSLDDLHKLVLNLRPDHWTLEPSQCRAEFKNVEESSDLDYQDLFLNLKNFNLNRKIPFWSVLKIKHIVRQVYYYFAEKTLLKNKSMLPCYAAISSVQISPEGDIWQCGTKCNSLGNLRESNYDLKKIFFGKKADKMRKGIKEKKCFCIQCNTFYTNLMCNPSSFVKYFLWKIGLKC